MVFERIIGILIAARDAAFPADDFTLTPFRDPSPGGTADAATLLALQSYAGPADPGYLLHDLFAEVAAAVDDGLDPPAAQLVALAAEIYQISAANGDADPGAYPNPVDVLRGLLRGEPLPASYAAEVTSTAAQQALAAGFPASLVGDLTPRPTEMFVATVTPSSFEGEVPVLRVVTDDSALRLFAADGSPFVFPRGIELPVGAQLGVLAFTDRVALPPGPGLAVEAIDATLVSIPEPPRSDADGDLIDDAWGDHFFAGNSVDAFGDPDGDGYSTFQEMLEGTDPTNGGSRPTAPRLAFGPLPIDIEPAGGASLRVFVHFPSRYAGEVGFALLADGGRAVRFDEIADDAAPDGFDTYGVVVEVPPGNAGNLFRFRMFLKR